MARTVSLADDITGETGATERYFAFGNDEYEIDLTDDNWQEFLNKAFFYIQNARPSKRKRTNDAPVADPADREAIRAWAIIHNRPIAARGRFPKDVIRDFYADQVKNPTHFVIG